MTPMKTPMTVTEASSGPATRGQLQPKIEFPEDRDLNDLRKLFDPAWVYSAYRSLAKQDTPDPMRFRIHQVSYTPGRVAIVSYIAEWDPEAYLPSKQFIARVERKKPIEVFQFPDDASLPGLGQAADPDAALKLVNTHVLSFGARRIRVEVVRYRPGSRAVLRHSVGRMRFYARVMRPAALDPFVKSWELVARSRFVAPRIAGHWADGGVVWMSEIPGENLRRLLRRGRQPDPNSLLEGLSTLWSQPGGLQQGQPFNLLSAYRRAQGLLAHFARESEPASSSIDRISTSLDAFVEAWRPSAVAHNDFYDDQILVLPNGDVALVDLEEAGPGDPMLDVGNFTAHLRWRSRFGRRQADDANASYLDEFRSAAIERFGWHERELNLREAVCLFRICTNVVRHPQGDWRDRLDAGLALVKETLD